MKAAFLVLFPFVAHAGALSFFNAGDFERAAVEAQQELRSNPDDVRALVLLGRAQLAAGRALEAVRTLTHATRRGPHSGEAHYRLGQALALQAADAGALRKLTLVDDIGRAFERAVELAPANAEYRWALFEFCRHAPGFLGGGRRKAEAQAVRLAELDPARGHRARASLLFQDGERDAAEREFRAAIAAAPTIADHRYALGYFYQQASRWNEAFGVFNEIARRFPRQEQASFQVGKTAALSGERLAEGAAALRRYLRHTPRADEPPLAWAHYRLALVYEHMGDVESAAREHTAALSLDADLKDARRALRALKRRQASR